MGTSKLATLRIFYWTRSRTSLFLLVFTQAGTAPTLSFVWYDTVIFPSPVQETVREAGFELGTAACHPVDLTTEPPHPQLTFLALVVYPSEGPLHIKRKVNMGVGRQLSGWVSEGVTHHLPPTRLYQKHIKRKVNMGVGRQLSGWVSEGVTHHLPPTRLYII
jgi:hypothetical protein